MPRKPRKTNKVYVLDAYALLAFLEAEEGGETVKTLLLDPRNHFYISVINLGEVYYTLLRERNEETAKSVISEVNLASNIRVVNVTWERARMASEFKARGGISYADCFAAALAAEKDALLLTGDSEFERLTDKIKIIWLS